MNARVEGVMTAEPVDDGWEWMIVEVMGHRRHAGRCREEARFGGTFLRIDVPNKGDPDQHGWTSHYYPPTALFSFAPAERDVCLAANKPYAGPSRLALRYDENEAYDEPV